MSRAASKGDEAPETAVRNRSQYADTLHRQDPESDEIRKVSHSVRNPRIDQADLAIECVQCGKPITGDGISVTVEERRYYLCCSSCESMFKDEYETLQAAADEA